MGGGNKSDISKIKMQKTPDFLANHEFTKRLVLAFLLSGWQTPIAPNSYWQKRFYDRERNSAALCVIQQMPIKPHSSSMLLQ